MKYLLLIQLICWAVAFVLAAYGTWRKAEVTNPPEPLKDQETKSVQHAGLTMVRTATVIFILGAISGIIYWFFN
jgi:hypothetical protein